MDIQKWYKLFDDIKWKYVVKNDDCILIDPVYGEILVLFGAVSDAEKLVAASILWKKHIIQLWSPMVTNTPNWLGRAVSSDISVNHWDYICIEKCCDSWVIVHRNGTHNWFGHTCTKLKSYSTVEFFKLWNFETKIAVETKVVPETKTPKIHDYKKYPIPEQIRTAVWAKYSHRPHLGTGFCFNCTARIEQKTATTGETSYHCGHIIAESKGGPMLIENFRPVCRRCNLKMGTKSMIDYVRDPAKKIELQNSVDDIWKIYTVDRTAGKILIKSLLNLAVANAITGTASCRDEFIGLEAIYHGSEQLEYMTVYSGLLFDRTKYTGKGKKFHTACRKLFEEIWTAVLQLRRKLAAKMTAMDYPDAFVTQKILIIEELFDF